MGNYYLLGAQLPSLRLDVGVTPEHTPAEFLALLRPQLNKKDTRLLELLLLRQDNDLLVRLLEGRALPTVVPEKGVLGEAPLRQLLSKYTEPTEEELLPPKGKRNQKQEKRLYPSYLLAFVEEYQHETEAERRERGFVADRLTAAYHSYIYKEGNQFLRTWFRLEEAVAAIFAAVAVRDYNLDARLYLIGESPLLSILRTKEWRELSYLKEADMVAEILRITDEEDLNLRERKIDALKWKVLDSFTFSDQFSINAMMAYLLRLEILDRWAKLDKEGGERTFRAIISSLSEEGKEELEEYRRKAEQSGALRRRR